MADVSDLSARRWKQASNPAAHPPREAIAAAMRDIDAGAIEPLHIVVVVALPAPDGGTQTRFYQAGEYNSHGQLGLLTRAAQIAVEP